MSGGPGVPSLDEIEATVARMEAALFTAPARSVAAEPAYRRLARRFDLDLADRRDRALSRGAALMMIRFLEAT